MKEKINGKNCVICEFCGKVKDKVEFVIGACSPDKIDWCMVCGTGKMACPDCYTKAMAKAKKVMGD